MNKLEIENRFITISDSLEKALFVVSNFAENHSLDSVLSKEESMYKFALEQHNMFMEISIVFDYLLKLKTDISGLEQELG